MSKILILQDGSSGILTEMLQKLQHKILEVSSISEALECLNKGDIDIVFIDHQTNKKPATKSLGIIKNANHFAFIPVVIITSHTKSEEVIEAMRLGAFDHLSKPVSLEELESVIKRAITKPKDNNLSENEESLSKDFLVGRSPVMRKVEKLIGVAAACDATVLIVGETGTGKDTIARIIHKHSKYAAKPLTVIDCTAVPEDYESFQSLSAGSSGTVILDEIGDLNAQMQAMLVRALKEAPIEPSPGSLPTLRIIATTQYDLVNMVKEKRFREDLYYRLNVLPIILPLLKERGSDIVSLSETFLAQANPQAPKQLSSSAAKLLLDYSWPGNVRELQNLMYHLNIVVPSSVVEEVDLSALKQVKAETQSNDQELDYHRATAALEKRLLMKALQDAHGSRAEAARLLGINRQLLYAKLKTHGLMD